jgi:PRC-barrel domain protein
VGLAAVGATVSKRRLKSSFRLFRGGTSRTVSLLAIAICAFSDVGLTRPNFAPKVCDRHTPAAKPTWHQLGFCTLKTEVFNQQEAHLMKDLALAVAGALIASTAALAQQPTGQGGLMTSIPANSRTVTDWYKQNVYDPQQQKIGEIEDLLVNQSGQVEAAMVGVGGFLGAGEKDVAVSFNAIKPTKKNDKTYLTLNTTKEALKNAPGFKYDRQSTTWVPDNRASNEKRSSR